MSRHARPDPIEQVAESMPEGPFFLRPTESGVAVCRATPHGHIYVGNYADRDKAMYVKMFLNQQGPQEVPIHREGDPE